MRILLDAEVNGQSPLIFSPGDLISGLLVLDPETSHSDINRICIRLEGRAGQVGERRLKGHSAFATLERRLFRQEQLLDRSQQSKGAEWRFEFALPTTWPWYFQSLPLPPSGVYHYDHGFMKLDTSSLDDPEASLQGTFDNNRALAIIYKLSVEKVEGRLSDKEKAARHLVVRPSVATAPAATGSNELVFKTLYWHPSSSSINKLYKMVKGSSQTNDKPSYKLDGSIVVPRSLWQGQHADVELSVACSNNTPPETSFVLQELVVKLMANTVIGTGTRWKSGDSTPNEIGHLRRKSDIKLGRECSRVKVSLDLGLDSLSLDLPSDYVPSFTSTAPGDHAEINYHHHLDIVAVLHDEDSGQLLSLRGTHAVTVHPRIRPSSPMVTVGVENGAFDSLHAQHQEYDDDDDDDDDALPPSYKEATQ